MIIGFSTTNALLSRIIKWATKSKASHSYAVFNIDGELLVIHANHTGINCDYYKTFVKKHKIVAEYELNIAEDLEHKACAYGMQKLDSPYDFFALIGIGWVIFNRALGRKIKNPFRNKSAYYCSEFILLMLQIINVQESFKIDREIVSPEDLIEMLDKLSIARKVI